LKKKGKDKKHESVRVISEMQSAMERLPKKTQQTQNVSSTAAVASNMHSSYCRLCRPISKLLSRHFALLSSYYSLQVSLYTNVTPQCCTIEFSISEQIISDDLIPLNSHGVYAVGREYRSL
jgi:hypothetical protein